MVEGDLLEVSLSEKLQLRNVLRSCRPSDYEQIVFGFPVNTSLSSKMYRTISVEPLIFFTKLHKHNIRSFTKNDISCNRRSVFATPPLQQTTSEL